MQLDSGTTLIKIDIDGRVSPNQEKAGCFTGGGNSAGNHSDMDLIFIEQTPRGNNNGGQKALNGKTPSVSANNWEHNNHLRVHNMMPRPSKTGKGGIGHLSKDGEKTYCIDTGQTNVIELPKVHQQDRVNSENGKARSVPAGSNGNASHHTNTETNGSYRRLTPIEVERLFTLPDGYTSAVSDSQRLKLPFLFSRCAGCLCLRRRFAHQASGKMCG